MIAFYFETRGMRSRVEGLLAEADLKTSGRREEFQKLLGEASVGIAELERCSIADVSWLRTVFGRGLAGPSCVLVTPLSLGRLRRFRRIESSRFHVVWAEEADEHLLPLVQRIEPWQRDPLRLLCHRLLNDHSLHWCLVRALKLLSRQSNHGPEVPPINSVTDISRHSRVPPDAFRRYWRTEIPLQCSPKQFLSWAVLLWAVRQRSLMKWDAIADRAGVRRRTLERYSVRMAGCTLAAAARHPADVQQRFEAWVKEAEKPPVVAAAVESHRALRRGVTDVQYRFRAQRQRIVQLADLQRLQPAQHGGRDLPDWHDRVHRQYS